MQRRVFTSWLVTYFRSNGIQYRLYVMLRQYTELEIENIAWELLRRKPKVRACLPIDVDLLLELQGISLVVVAGLIPRFSIECCAYQLHPNGEVIVAIEKFIADSRSEPSYRQILAKVLGHLTLHKEVLDQTSSIEDYLALRSSPAWPHMEHDAHRFAVSLMAPEELVAQAAAPLYAQLIAEQGFGELRAIEQQLRNCLATTFLVTTEQIHQRMVRWPCQIYQRVRKSVSLGSPQLLPLDSGQVAQHQRRLFLSGRES